MLHIFPPAPSLSLRSKESELEPFKRKVGGGGRGGDLLAVQCLGLRAFTAVGPGSIPGKGIRISQASRHGRKKKKNPFQILDCD